jgi:hypothetical protein
VADQSFFDKNSATLQLKSLSGSKSCGCGRRRYLTAHTALTAQHFPHLAPVKPPPPPANGITPGISRLQSPIIEPNRLRDEGLSALFALFTHFFLERRTISPCGHQTALFREDTPRPFGPIYPAVELPGETHPKERTFLFPTGGPILLGTLSAGDWARSGHHTGRRRI